MNLLIGIVIGIVIGWLTPKLYLKVRAWLATKNLDTP